MPRIAGLGPLRIPAPITSPVLQGLAALAIYLAVWLAAGAFALVLHPTWAQLDQHSMDPNFYTWSLRWWPYAIGHGLNPLHTTQVSAPMGAGLAWVTTVPPLALLVAPLTELAGPLVSFNLLVAVSLPVSAWAAFVLCRRLTGRFWPALVAGALFGFSAYQLNHAAAGQLNLTFSLLLPLMAYLVLLWRDGKLRARAFVGLLALAMALQFYLFLETFADMTAVWAVALLAGYAVAGPAGRPAVARLSRLAGLAYLLAIVVAAPYLGYALTNVPKGFARSPAMTALDLASLVVPRPTQTFGLTWLAHYSMRMQTASAEGYVGIPLLILAVALAIYAWSNRLARFLLVMLVFLILAAMGPALQLAGRRVIGLPWASVWNLPIVRSAFPARFMVFAFLALAVMAALWLTGPSKRSWARWLLALLAVAAFAANTPPLTVPNRPGLPAFISAGEYRHYLAPGDIVVVASRRGNAGMLWQAETDFYTRLAGGYINAAINNRTDLPKAVAALGKRRLSSFDVRQFDRFLHRAGITAILVEASSPQRWPVIFDQLGLRGQEVGGVILYRTNR